MNKYRCSKKVIYKSKNSIKDEKSFKEDLCTNNNFTININNSNDYLANIAIPDNSHNLEYVKTEEINSIEDEKSFKEDLCTNNNFIINVNNSNDYLANIVIPDNSHNLEYVKTEEINQNAGNY